MQEIELGMLILFIFSVGFLFGFFSLFILSAIRNYIYSNSKKRKKEEFRRMIKEIQIEESEKNESRTSNS